MFLHLFYISVIAFSWHDGNKEGFAELLMLLHKMAAYILEFLKIIFRRISEYWQALFVFKF